jgi:hypothetical protein
MTMNRKKFGVGFVAGLLVALGVVATSGASGGGVLFPGFTAAVPASNSATTSQTMVSTTTASATATQSTSTYFPLTVNYSSTASSVSGTTSSVGTKSIGNMTAGLLSVPSDSIGAISSEPSTSWALLLLPILVAVLLASVFYQRARRQIVGSD